MSVAPSVSVAPGVVEADPTTFDWGVIEAMTSFVIGLPSPAGRGGDGVPGFNSRFGGAGGDGDREVLEDEELLLLLPVLLLPELLLLLLLLLLPLRLRRPLRGPGLIDPTEMGDRRPLE